MELQFWQSMFLHVNLWSEIWNLKSTIQNSKFLSCYGVCHCLVGLCKLPFSGQSLTFFEQVLTLLSRYVLGTIPILRQCIYGLFQTHPPTMPAKIQYWPSAKIAIFWTHPVLLLWLTLYRNGPLLGSDFGSPSRFDSKIQTEADFEKIDEFIILTSAQWFKG